MLLNSVNQLWAPQHMAPKEGSESLFLGNSKSSHVGPVFYHSFLVPGLWNLLPELRLLF